MPGIVGIFGRTPDTMGGVDAFAAALTLPPEGVRGTEPLMPGVDAGWALHRGGAATGAARAPDGTATAIVAGELFLEHGPSTDPGALVLRAYAEHGDRFVEHLSGSFAGILADVRRGVALLFNDRFGAGRLYVHETADGLYVASEAKVLLRSFPATRRLDPGAVAETISLGCTLRNRTLYEGIALLPPGSLWVCDGAGVQRRGRWAWRCC